MSTPPTTPLKTPDISPAQILAMIAAVVGLFVSQGVIDNGRAQLITGIASIVLPFVWVVADSIIRHGRSTGAKSPVVVVPPAVAVPPVKVATRTPRPK